MVEYILEGNLIDLDKDTEIELTISINDIRNPVTINNSWSKSIDIPGTPNNNKVFEFIYDNNIEVGYNPNLKRDCELRVDGIPIIIGYQKINEINIINGRIIYKVIIYGNNTTIFEEMGDSLITDLNLEKYNHTYTKSNVVTTWETATREGFYYPFSNYHDKTWSVHSIINNIDDFPFYPGFYVKTIVDKMFETYEYEYESDFFESDMFKSLYIPYTNSLGEDYVEIIETDQVYTQDYIGITGITTSYEYDPLSIYSGISFTTPCEGIWELSMSGHALTYSGYTFTSGFIVIRSQNPNSEDPDIYTDEYRIDFNNYGSSTDSYSFDFSYVFENLGNNRIITIAMYAVGEGSYSTGYDFNMLWKLKSDVFLYNLSEIKASETLPKNLKQKDFFNTLIRMFNLYVERDPNDPKKLTIEPFNEYYNKSTTVDWTYKVDESSRKYKLMSELNNKSYTFNYKEDKDYLNEKYKEDTNTILGSIQVFTQNDFLNNNEKIELLCSPTTIEYITGDSEYGTYWPSMRKEMTEDKTSLDDYDVSTGWNWRILSQNVIETGSGFTINYNSVDYTNFYTGSHLILDSGGTITQSLWFDNKKDEITYLYDTDKETPTLYSQYWDEYLNLIKNQNSRLLSMDVFLSTNDIGNLRFYNKIFIKDSYYYLNQLIYSPTSKISKVELLLIPATDIQEIYFKDMQVSDKYAISGETFTASVMVNNIGQTTGTYYGTWYIDLYDESGNTWNNIYDLEFEDTLSKNSNYVYKQILPLTELGYLRIRLEAQDEFSFTKYIYHLNDPIVFSNLSYIAGEGLYTGRDIYIKFTIYCNDELFSDTLSGTITSSSTESHNWEKEIDGKGYYYITQLFTLVEGTNTFVLTGDYVNSLSVYVTNATSNIIKGNWVFDPSDPHTAEQTSSLEAYWKIINTGAGDCSGLTIQFYAYTSPELDLPVYTSTSSNQTVSGNSYRYFTFVMDDLPDGYGSTSYLPIPLYIRARLTGAGYDFWDNPGTESAYPVYIQPCSDNWGLSNQTITSPATGDTTTVINSFRITVNGCNAISSYTHKIKTSYYDGDLEAGVRPNLYTILYEWIDPTSVGDYDDISESFTPPNTWSDGYKSVKVEIVNPLGEVTELYRTGYTYYIGYPDIDYVSSSLSCPSQFYTIQCDIVATNNGTGGGYAYATYDFRKPDDSIMSQHTGSTTYFAVGQTKTLSLATSLPECLNGTYTCHARLHEEDGTVIQYTGLTYVQDKYHTIGWDGFTNVDLSDLDDLIITIEIKLEAYSEVSEGCGWTEKAEATANFYVNGIAHYIGASCYANNSFNSDYDTDTLSFTGITSGSTISISSSVDNDETACFDKYGYIKATIVSIDITSGTGGVCVDEDEYVDYGPS